MQDLLQQLYLKNHLTQQQSESIFTQLIQGQLTESQMAGLLISLKMNGEQAQEIAGAVQALKKASRPFSNPFQGSEKALADSCGTGGSGKNTLNISTMVALLLASMGMPMVKHGNRSISSKCGSADLLEKFGVKIDMNSQQAQQCLADTNFCFLFAPAFHPGVRHVMPVRNQLATRTIFNLIGPLINPANPSLQLMGVYAPELCQLAAETLKLSGCDSAMVVHCEGYDEITLHGETQVVEVKDGSLLQYSLTNKDFGFAPCQAEDISGNDPQSNADFSLSLLKGELDSDKKVAVANTIGANAGALLYLSDKSLSLKQASHNALSALSNGLAFKTLQQVIDYSQSLTATEE
ncbi:MAG: anthranilate phosphoribosyltransferase [Enterobacterales bacterium]|nr:anthranilate phosphoribosyltransferase [Enterobacterales bacterium]